jgi:hypothetical protein
VFAGKFNLEAIESAAVRSTHGYVDPVTGCARRATRR